MVIVIMDQNKTKYVSKIITEEALVKNNLHFMRYGSFGVLVQPERKNTYSRQ